MKSGEIWLVDLSDAKGHEQRGVRPAILVGAANGLVVVIPLTGNRASARFSHTHVIPPDNQNGLDTDSVALVFQIVSLGQERFRHRLGVIGEHHLRAILVLLSDLLDLSEH